MARRKYKGYTYGRSSSSTASLSGSLYADVKLEDGAPREFAAAADSTFGTYDLIAYVLTYNGAQVETCTKRVGVESESSQHTEGVASVKCSSRILYARTVLAALGVPCGEPTVLLTDNKANMLVANDAGSSVRSRHFLRMYRLLQQRIGDGDIAIKHVPDAENPADALTKWIDVNKFEKCVAYMAGERPTPV